MYNWNVVTFAACLLIYCLKQLVWEPYPSFFFKPESLYGPIHTFCKPCSVILIKDAPSSYDVINTYRIFKIRMRHILFHIVWCDIHVYDYQDWIIYTKDKLVHVCDKNVRFWKIRNRDGDEYWRLYMLARLYLLSTLIIVLHNTYIYDTQFWISSKVYFFFNHGIG